MENDPVEKFNDQTFAKGSAILRIKYYNLQNLIVQHLPVKETVKKNKKLIVCVLNIL